MSETSAIARQLLADEGKRTDEFVARLLDECASAPSRLIESIRYSVTAGGKRLRPALVLQSAHACGADAQGMQTALAAAGAIELVHTFSLVHDDLPAMDDDDLRRGRPTNHKVFGQAMAILAGDAMVFLAFQAIARHAPADLCGRLVAELAAAAGADGMIGGQVLDIQGEGQSLSLGQLQRLHAKKTGALLTTACRLGAISARADDAKILAISEFGRCIGLAFQIVDDLLDVTSTPGQLGKATGKDAGKGKNTYPQLLGLDPSRAEAARQLDSALAALNSFGPSADGLRALALFVVERTV
jgi:geranylgeranyl diphosphate synthase, type II